MQVTKRWFGNLGSSYLDGIRASPRSALLSAHRKLIYSAQASLMGTTSIVTERSSAYLIDMTEVSVGNKRHEKRPRKQRARKDLLVPGFTEFKALLLFHKQRYKYLAIMMQHCPVSSMNLSIWFILTPNTKVWAHRSPSPSLRFGNVNTCPNSALFLAPRRLGCCFCVAGWNIDMIPNTYM